MRWLWIDRFLEFHRGQSARAIKNLSMAEDLFAEHFPGYPVMPAALTSLTRPCVTDAPCEPSPETANTRSPS